MKSTIICPKCGKKTTIVLPKNVCLSFLKCPACRHLINSGSECCVACAHGDVRCEVAKG